MDQQEMDDNFTQFTDEVPYDMEGNSNENPDFILECGHSSQPEQSANDNENNLGKI